MRSAALGLVIVLAGGGCFGMCAQPTNFIQEGTCVPTGAMPSVDALEIGDGDDPFHALSNGDAIHPVYGGQGARMIVVRLRVRGAGAPACLPQSTLVLAADGSGTMLAGSSASLSTTVEIGGARTTGQLFLPGAIPRPGDGLRVTTDAGGKTISRALSVETPGFFDLAPAVDQAAPASD